MPGHHSLTRGSNLQELYFELAEMRAAEARRELEHAPTDRAFAQSARALEDAAGALGHLASLLDGGASGSRCRDLAMGVIGAAADCELAADVARQAARG
jgi:hypothetical protein